MKGDIMKINNLVDLPAQPPIYKYEDGLWKGFVLDQIRSTNDLENWVHRSPYREELRKTHTYATLRKLMSDPAPESLRRLVHANLNPAMRVKVA
jgi:hypothetical protein